MYGQMNRDTSDGQFVFYLTGYDMLDYNQIEHTRCF